MLPQFPLIIFHQKNVFIDALALCRFHARCRCGLLRGIMLDRVDDPHTLLLLV